MLYVHIVAMYMYVYVVAMYMYVYNVYAHSFCCRLHVLVKFQQSRNMLISTLQFAGAHRRQTSALLIYWCILNISIVIYNEYFSVLYIFRIVIAGIPLFIYLIAVGCFILISLL